ncbi:MAG: type II toxin-antitoxin system HicA family toxin [Candidatus Villigracilaceae bacterium]
MKYREIARRLKMLGCKELSRRGKGSHRVWHNPANGRIASLPNWGTKDLKVGTLKAASRQLGLDWDEFTRK